MTLFRGYYFIDCAGNFTDDEGTLESPNYPNSYYNYMNCVYRISTTNGAIKVEFEDFDLESGGTHCPFDFVAVGSSV